jgi:Bacterial Ig-like domain (group 3)/FG-GAP-like repeat
VLLTDIDGDGFGDLVVVYYNTAPNPVGAGPVSPYQVWIWWGNGDGTFNQAPLVLNLTRNYYLGAVADMNGDGYPDLVLSDGSMISIVYNQGNRGFGTPLPSGLYPSEQHFLAGQGINSLTLADVNGDNVPDVVVANGGATISNALALGGKTAASIALAPNPSDINTGGITVLLNRITTKPVTGTLVATPEPSIYSTPFTMTATLTSSAGIAPAGQVAFYLDTVLVGTGLLAPVAGSATTSAATVTIPLGNPYLAGVHPMSAVFLTDGVNTGVTLFGPPTAHLVKGGPTSSEIFMCIGPTAACPAPPGVPNPRPQYFPTLFMSYGQIWNGQIDVRSNDPIPLTGTIQLIDTYTGPDVPPPTPLCVLPVNLGTACSNSVGTTQGTSVGLNVLTAFYPGDAFHPASTSGPVAITVLPDTTLATLIGSPNPSPAKLPVTFTATVTGNIVAPTGPIAFSFGGQPLGQAQLVPGLSGTTSTATFTTSTLPVGNDLITASYGGTIDFNAVSASFTETITPSLAGNFNLTVAPTPVSVGVGYATLLAVAVVPLNGFSQDVTLSCANLPSEATCFFDSATISGGSGTTNLVVGTNAPHSCGTTQPYFLGSNGGGGVAPYALPALAGLLAIFLPGKRRWLRALIAVVLVGGVTQMTGCGTCTDLGTRPATYTFQIVGAAANTSEVETQTVTFTVTI